MLIVGSYLFVYTHTHTQMYGSYADRSVFLWGVS
jgi:hypothetical protein